MIVVGQKLLDKVSGVTNKGEDFWCAGLGDQELIFPVQRLNESWH
jgi:hypothetical protein